MLLILRSFLEIVLLIRPPQDLPSDRRLLYTVILSYFLVGLLMLWPELGALVSGLVVVADIMVTMAFIQVVLHLKKHPQRMIQTLTAVMGAGTLISIMMLPLVYGIYSSRQDGGEASSIVALGIYVLFAWSITINAHIFRYAFDLSNLFFGILYALGLYVFSEIVMAILFGAQLGGT
jgi:hypothetical protein